MTQGSTLLGMATLDEYKATIELPDGSTYSHQGEMDYLSAQVNPDTDTYEARALFDNEVVEGRDADLIPGQYTPLNLIVGSRPDSLLIPQAALIQSQAGMHVYVLDKDNKVDHRKIEVGGAYEHYWVITKGLSKGETVIGDIEAGDMAVVTLISYPDTPLTGKVDSLGWGIAQDDGSTGYNLLPSINATFEWIRLAQRVPVRIHLDEMPAHIKLRVGTTASVLVMSDGGGHTATVPPCEYLLF